MKNILILLMVFMFCSFSEARGSGRVRGYTKKSGKYVKPHHRTLPDKTKKNNYSHKGNVNPYTGKEGTKE